MKPTSTLAALVLVSTAAACNACGSATPSASAPGAGSNPASTNTQAAASDPAAAATDQPAAAAADTTAPSGKQYQRGDAGPAGGVVFTKTDAGYLEYAKDKFGPFTWDEAQKACAAYRGGGMSDWRLPSKDELNAMHDAVGYLLDHNKLPMETANTEWAAWYWSGEQEQGKWWVQRFDYGNQFLYPKDKQFYARPVRSFR
jgi:hypothetical protein